MRLKRKILLTLGTALFVILGTLAGIFYYYYTHPDSIKPLVEKSISQSTGTTCTIKTLAYSLKPLHIRASGISFKPGKGLQGVHARIPDISADMELKGSMGRRTLVVKHLEIQGASFQVHEEARMPGTASRIEGASLLARFLRRAIGLLLFRDIEFGGAQLSGGDISVKIPNLTFRMEKIVATINRERFMELRGIAQMHYPSRGLSLRIPELVLRTHRIVSLVNPELNVALTAKNATLVSPYGKIRQVHAEAKIGYFHNKQRLALEPLRLRWEGPDANLSFTTRTLIHIKERMIEARHMDLDFEDALGFRGSAKLVLEPLTSLDCDISEFRLMPKKLLGLIPLEFKKDMLPLPLSGPVLVHGNFKANKKDGEWLLDPDLQITLDQNPFDYRHDQFQIQGGLTGFVQVRGRSPELGVSLHMKGEDMVFSGKDFKSLFSNLEIRSRSIFNLAEKTCRTSSLSLALTDILKLEGGLQLQYGPLSHIAFKCSEGSVSMQKIPPLLPGYLRREILPLKMKGPVRFNGLIEGERTGMAWRWIGDLHSHFVQNPLSYEKDGVQVKAKVSGDLRLKGPILNPDLTAELKIDQAMLSGIGIKTDPFKAHLSLSGKDGILLLDTCDLTIPSLTAKLGEREVSVSDIQVLCPGGQYNSYEKSFHASEVRVNTPLFKNLLLSFTKDRGGIDLQLKGEEIGLLPSARSLGILPEGWRASGKDRMQCRVSQSGKGPWRLQAALELHGLNFENRQSSCIGEQISLNSRIKAEFDSKARSLAGKISLESGKGELLLDRFYFDLGRNPFSFSLEGTGDGLKRSAKVSHGLVQLKDVLALQLQGDIRKEPEIFVAGSLKLLQTPLKNVFEHLVLEPFQPEHPILGSLRVGGTLSADLEVAGSLKGWTATGYSHWRQGRISSGKEGIILKEINLDLPIWIEKQRSRKVQNALEGRLLIGDATLPFIQNKTLELPLTAEANMLAVPGATVLRTAGGNIKVGPVLGKNLYSSKRSVHTSVGLDNIRVAPLLANIWSQPLEGIVDGRLDPIDIIGNRLTGKGKVKADIFDGKIIFYDVGMLNPFSSAPVYELSADWQDLNLEKITSGTGFGKMEGIIQGYVKGLEIAYGQPQKFDLFVETIKKKGVDQKISQLAVNNIAQVAGGRNAAAGMSGGMAFFLKDVESAYKKIGIRASLRNDRFKINGTIHEEGKEYLIKRPWHSGVDVINWEPENSIRFKDMMKRIKNVEISSDHGPMIR